MEERIINPREQKIPELNVEKLTTLRAHSLESIRKLLGKYFIVNSRQEGFKLIGKLESDANNPEQCILPGLVFQRDEQGGHLIFGERYMRHAPGKYGIKDEEEFILREPRFVYSERVSKRLEEDLKVLLGLPIHPIEPFRGKKL